MAPLWRHYGAIWRHMARKWRHERHMAPYGAIKLRHMAPLNGVDGDKNGAPPLFIWQKQKMAPYGANGAIFFKFWSFAANGAIWRHI